MGRGRVPVHDAFQRPPRPASRRPGPRLGRAAGVLTPCAAGPRRGPARPAQLHQDPQGRRASSTRRITSAPGAAVDAIPPPRAGHGTARAARSSSATARCGGPGTRGIRSRPLAPPREERPGHHQAPRSNHVVRRYALLPPRTPTPSARSRATCGSRSTSSSTHPAPTRKPIGWGADKAGGRKRLRAGPRTPWTGCWPPTPAPTAPASCWCGPYAETSRSAGCRRARGGAGGASGTPRGGACPNLLQRRPATGSAARRTAEYQRFSFGAPARSGPLQQIWTTDPPVD